MNICSLYRMQEYNKEIMSKSMKKEQGTPATRRGGRDNLKIARPFPASEHLRLHYNFIDISICYSYTIAAIRKPEAEFDGASLHPEVCEKLFDCNAAVKTVNLSGQKETQLTTDARIHADATLTAAMERNNAFYKEECERLFRWADDLTLSAEKELKDTKSQLREQNRQLRLATSQQDRLAVELKIKELSKKQREQRQRIFDVEDEIAVKRDTLIDQLKKWLEQKTNHEHLFTIRWKVV